MNTVTQLPDLSEKPSVMSKNEVESVFIQIMDAAESNFELKPLDVLEALDEAISAQGYTESPYDEAISLRIFNWIKAHWVFGDYEFANVALTSLVNIDCHGRDAYILELIQRESDQGVVTELAESHAEIINLIKNN